MSGPRCRNTLPHYKTVIRLIERRGYKSRNRGLNILSDREAEASNETKKFKKFLLSSRNKLLANNELVKRNAGPNQRGEIQ